MSLQSTRFRALLFCCTEQVKALDAILDFVDDVNYATDFFKLGGFGIIARFMRESPDAPVRAKCAEVAAELVQNYDWGQAEAKKHGGLELLVSAFREDADENVKINSFSAISRLVRDSEEEIRMFSIVHPDVVEMALRPESPVRLKTKAAFFLCHILSACPAVAENYSPCVKSLADLYGEDSSVNAFVLSSLTALWTQKFEHPSLLHAVRARRDKIRGQDQYEEESAETEKFMNVADL
jgi:hypothetical protein